MVEEVVSSASDRPGRPKTDTSQPTPIGDVAEESILRIPTGLPEVDRVLGGGVVPGGFILLGGDPGIGKSTLLLQIAARVALSGPVLYITAEESLAQTRLRAERLGSLPEGLFLLAEGDIHQIERVIARQTWKMVVVDSLQTVFNPELESAPGSVGQVRDIAARLMRVAKRGCPIFLVGHVNKEGSMRPVA
ncbi:MAG: AAA family ATPase [Thermaerobacter sp.]|nr:AAA family ATPase [Thermaerobacter sp.]